MSKHTPGPWTVENGFPSVSAPSAPNLALCNDSAIPVGERKANARLIAAAPDLLEALQSIADCCDEEHAARDYASRQTEIRGIARAAIAKAEGEQE